MVGFLCSGRLSLHPRRRRRSSSLPPQRLHLRAGTPTYMAPECLGRDYHIEADLWVAARHSATTGAPGSGSARG